MKQINIKQNDTIIFEKYFSQCDIDKTGKVSSSEANKFFLRSGLSIDDIYKINEYCGANRLGYFGRSQFYIALKAIASAQAGHFVNEEIIRHTSEHLPPRFDYQVSEEAVKTVLEKSLELETHSAIPPPPNKFHMRTLSGNNILHSLHHRSLMNRYPYSCPTAKLHNQPLNGSPGQFTVKFNSFDQTDRTHTSFFESDDEENNVESYEEEDNKGLLNPSIKTEFSHLYSLNGDDAELSSSSSDHESSSFTGESEENEDNVDNDGDSHDPTGYTLMEAVEGLAVMPTDNDNTDAIPMATEEQLEYYTKCFQTIQSSDTHKVFGSDAIGFFQLYQLEDEHIDKILLLTSIEQDSEISLVQFSRALHLITHQKTGFSIPDKEPENLLPVDFEQPDEPFSFDLSTGEHADMQTINQLSSLDSSYSADGDSSNFDSTDAAARRGWKSQNKVQLNSTPQRKCFLSKSFNLSTTCDPRGKIPVVSRPRPYARKSLSLPQAVPSPVAPPPPPRSSVPSEPLIRTIVSERLTDPSGDASSTSSSDDKSAADEDENPRRKHSESSKSDVTATIRNISNRQSTNLEARRQYLNSIKESKSKNHVLLRLNNEMTSELEELREQRVNLHRQLDYIKQSQLDNE